MRSPFVLPESVRGFSQYAEFNVNTETVLAALGFEFTREALSLPSIPVANLPTASKAHIRQRVESALRVVGFTSEMARREFLIAPVVLEAVLIADGQLASEHPFDISPRLHGSLDYLLQKANSVIVVEAKNGDLVRGFTQLSAEMVALDTFAEESIPSIYGAVTIGNLWQFGRLNRTEKRIIQDTNQFTVPEELDELLSVLVGILQDAPPKEQ